MKLHFDPHQPHQRAAIDAVLNLWHGQPFVTLHDALDAGRSAGVVANRLTLDRAALLARVRAHQHAEDLPSAEAWPPQGPPQLSVEMETGTGKTYVYLRTILSLAQRYGVRKIVVVVPSVAVREGVLKTLRITREHFASLMAGLEYRFFAYDGARLGRVRTFARSSQVELMVLTLDAFNKASNRMRQVHDGFGGRTPLEMLQATRPVVVLDEPQRMESPQSRAALADLHPLVILRYSATHRDRHALVHRLTPYQAHAAGLVKHIEVAAPAAGLSDRMARLSAQLRTTIMVHLQRQAQLRPRGIKVLSLLFVPRVDDWVGDEGPVRTLFARHFDELKASDPKWATQAADRVCAAYFATRHRAGRRQAIDSRTGRSAADQDAYVLIMRDKERLLSLDEPVSFVVSHSALREGWDNPNIFQICTMADSRSTIKKRQEIGRGVRLAVDQQGRRVEDVAINVLTVIVNDSYEAYVAAIQREEQEAVPHGAAAPVPQVARARSSRTLVEGSLVPEASWWAIDEQRLRSDALAALRRRASGSVHGSGALDGIDPVRATSDLLLRQCPPCLVGRRTIELVVKASASLCGATGWQSVELAKAAIVEAVEQQVPSHR